MHTVHVPQANYGDNNNFYVYAVMGVLFDTSEEVAAKFDKAEIEIIDEFFEF